MPEFDRIRAVVAATDVPGYGRPGRNERPLEKPSRAQSLDIAHWLVAYGFDDADELTALQKAGADPIDAWVRQNSLSTARNRAILAEQVVVAEPVSLDLGNGFDYVPSQAHHPFGEPVLNVLEVCNGP